MRHSASFFLSYVLIRAAGVLVPGARRAEWLREWTAELHSVTTGSWRFACGSWADATCLRMERFGYEEFLQSWRERVRAPGFCLASLAAVLGVLTLVSGFLPVTRDVVLPLPYRNPGSLATITQGGFTLGTRWAVPLERIKSWRSESRLVEDIAAYSWKEEAVDGASGVVAGRVSNNFFTLLGIRTIDGQLLEARALRDCWDCVLLSYDYWKSRHHGRQVRDVMISGRRHTVAGVLDKNFWFVSREVALWTIGEAGRGESSRSGVIARLSRTATKEEVEQELERVNLDQGSSPWEALVDVSMLQPRVRSVFGSFLFALMLALTIIVTKSHLRLPGCRDLWSRARRNAPSIAFFLAKTMLALLALLVAGMEFTPASSITMLGGTDVVAEPFCTWLFLMASVGILTWSIHDQRRRCRVCLRRLGMAAHVGCSGSLLLDWAGTELVCIEGHGMLHVPEMASSWHDPEQWTALDESWVGLFVRR